MVVKSPFKLVWVWLLFFGFTGSHLMAGATSIVGWGKGADCQLRVSEGLTNAVAVAAGADHSLALREDGTVAAWGNNAWRQTQVPPGLTNIIAIVAGLNHNLALKSNGTIIAWGDNGYGQLNIPRGLSNVVAIAAGDYHSLALQEDGTIVAWGRGDYSQTNRVPGLSNIVAVAAGREKNAYLRSDGSALSWRFVVDPWKPMQIVKIASDIQAVAARNFNHMVLRKNGTVATFETDYILKEVSGLSNVVWISAGSFHYLALKADSALVGWSDLNDYLPRNYWQTNIPPGLTNIIAIAAGGWHNLALMGSPEPVATLELFNPVRSGQTFSLSLATQPRKNYLLQYKEVLEKGEWQFLRIIRGDGSLKILSDPSAKAGQRFYRVRRLN